MAALEESMHAGLDRGILKRFVSALLIADFPMENMIALLFAILTQNRSIRIQSFVGIHQDRQLFVFHLN